MSGAKAAAPKGRRGLYQKSASVFRWLHIYISMLSFGALFFFAFTGITLNHPTWFGAAEQTVRDLEGRFVPELLTEDPDRLGIAERLREEHRLRGAVAEFRVSEYDYMVVFKGPGYAADIFIDRETGHYTVTETASGTMALLNDLHKGRDSGAAWSWVIDVSAVITLLASLSGFGLLLYIKKRRVPGVFAALAGTAVLVAAWAIWVP
ncbi:MAG: PepSY-associated TM helix domain-containing protein [Planctomycetota bacterium]